MSFAKDVWQTLSQINVNEHTETKGDKVKLTYLSWTWAWATLMEHYPESDYQFSPDTVYDDGTVEVSVTVTVREGDQSLSRYLWLPVMSHNGSSITKPSSRQRSDARMRCLVKCLAMFGLGHYIYAGEDIPSAEKDKAEAKPDPLPYTAEQRQIFHDAILTGDAMLLTALMGTCSEEAQTGLHNSFDSGAKSSGKVKVRELTTQGIEQWTQLIADIHAMLDAQDGYGLKEAVSELSKIERAYLHRRLGDKTSQMVGDTIRAAQEAA